MSFGWSAADLAAAVKILYKVGVALKESGGASSDFQDTLAFLQTLSLTLRHIKAIQMISYDPEASENLKTHCELIRVPVEAFLTDIRDRYESHLGHDTKWYKIQPAWKKMRWALSVSDKTKILQARITGSMSAIGVIMMHQAHRSVLRMPEDVQQKVQHTLEEKFPDLVDNVTQSLNALAITNAKDTTVAILQMSRTATSCNQIVSERVQSQLSEIQKNYRRLERRVDKAITAANHQSLGGLNQNPHLKQRLSKSFNVLELAAASMSSVGSGHEAQAITQDIFRDLWRLIFCLQRMVHELILLLIPYLMAFYQNTVPRLLLCGDHFLFEDGLGRNWRLSCAEHQNWDVFCEFLTSSFRNSPGRSFVPQRLFTVMNAYNGVTITPETWQASMQPKSKFVMTMIAQTAVATSGRCPDPLCNAKLVYKRTATTTKQTCPLCRKFILDIPAYLDLVPFSASQRTFMTGDRSPLSYDIVPEFEMAHFKRISWAHDWDVWTGRKATSTVKDAVTARPDKETSELMSAIYIPVYENDLITGWREENRTVWGDLLDKGPILDDLESKDWIWEPVRVSTPRTTNKKRGYQ